MQIQRNGDTVTMQLQPACTIVDVEAHTELVQQTLTDDAGIRIVRLDVGAVEEIDTAYLQLLLMVQAHMHSHGGECTAGQLPPCMTEALACYGLKLS